MSLFRPGKMYTCYLDISPGSCGIAVTETIAGKKSIPKVITTRRIPLSDTSHPENQLRSLKRAADELLATCVSELSLHSYDIVFLIHAPFSTTAIYEYEKKFDKETVITNKILEELHASYTKGKDTSSSLQSENHIIHEYVQTIFLNGYPTKKPFGKVAHTLSAKIVEDSVRGTFFETILSPLTINARTAKFVGYSQFVGRMLTARTDVAAHEFAFVSMGKMHSEISIYSGGSTRENTTIHFGTYVLVEALAKIANISRESAETVLRLHTTATADATYSESLKEAIALAQKSFAEQVNKAMKPTAKLPNMIYYVQDSEWSSAVQEVLQDAQSLEGARSLIHVIVDNQQLSFSPLQDARLLYGIFAILSFSDVQDTLT
ncbi:MAG: hypothetical protein WAX38_04260 [Minisyncoccia bacterium]